MTLAYIEVMEIRWEQVDAHYIATRSQRYPGALDIDVEWTCEALRDVDVKEANPDPKGLRGDTIRYVGYSPSAGRVLVVIAAVEDGVLYGHNAWPATGGDLRWYESEDDDD